MSGTEQPPTPAPAPEPTPAPAPEAVRTSAPSRVWPPPPFDLTRLLLPANWSLDQLETEARRVYFEDLVPNPPQTPDFGWFERRTLIIAPTEGGFQKVFGESIGWATYSHHKTGELDTDRLRTAAWIRPVLELRVPKTEVYVNSHSMRPREHGPRARREKKRVFVALGKGLSYFISLVYTEHGLALGTAFVPDGEWLRKMKASSIRLSP